MSDVSYSGPLNDWMAQAPPQPPPRVFGKSLASLLGPYLGITKPNDQAGPQPMAMAQPPVIGNRPDVQEAVKSAGAGAVEPFGQLGRAMTGQSQDTLGDIVGAAAGLAPIGPPGAGKALRAGAEAVEGAIGKGAAAGAGAIAQNTGGLSDFIKAYHGSPHDFDRFDLSKIGTGEGAQAYGHGLYFAENEGVAKGYRDTLADHDYFQPDVAAAAYLKKAGGDRQQAARTMLAHAGDQNSVSDPALADSLKKGADLLRGDAALPELSQPGRMYQVAIKAPPEHFLDWDKPLSEQSPKVQEAIKKLPLSASDMKDILGDQGFSGMHLVQAMNWHPSVAEGSADRTTAALREAGIPGIKYLDQGSRARSRASIEAELNSYRNNLTEYTRLGKTADAEFDGRKVKELEQELANFRHTRNYVVFDHNLIDILKKYGIAGVGALPAMNAYHFQKSDTGS